MESPRLGCNESIVPRQESSCSLESTRQIFSEIFDDKSAPSPIYGELGNIEEIHEMPEPVKEPVILPMPNVEVKLNMAKTNRMYKDLNIDLGLRDIFAEFNYKQLMEIKKLHLLYGLQKNRMNQSKAPAKK